jgi:predicted oxidoreductase
MKMIGLGGSGVTVPSLAVGCMRISGLDAKGAEAFVKSAMDAGANFFDHAAVYGDGECESIFAKAIGMNSAVREKMFLQTKCGIVRGKMFDFSREHILESADASLQRLKTDYLDILLLHRPDALVEPEEVAAAFDELHAKGKVRHFGVSNQNPMQMALLQKHLRQPILVNQLQLSAAFSTMISAGMHVNMLDDASVDRDGGVLDYCRLHDITVQPWSPFQYGFFEGVFVDNPKFPELNAKLSELAAKYGITPTGVAFAWLTRHPANFQPVTGTMKSARLLECVRATDVRLSREDWYAVYLAAGNTLP